MACNQPSCSLTHSHTRVVCALCVTGSGGRAADGDDSTARQPRNAKKVQALRRPVICVCNDLYAQVIRPLRDVAATFQFKQPRVRPREGLSSSSFELERSS